MAHRLTRAVLTGIAIQLLSVAIAATPARAGSYTVTGTCGQWTTGGSGVAIFPACPQLVVRNVYQAQLTPYGAGGGWRFEAPAGTTIASASLRGSLVASNGWQAHVYTEGANARELMVCPDVNGCAGGSAGLGDFPTYDSSVLNIVVRCLASPGCPGTALYGQGVLSASTITLTDNLWPSAELAGGSLLSGGWKTGTQTLTVDSSDNAGVREVRAVMDRARVASVVRSCDYTRTVPCPNGQTTLQISLSGLSDGAHGMWAEAVDAAGNVRSTHGFTIYVDNTPPTQPLDPQISGGAGWRSQDRVEISWRNPPQSAAPITGAAYRICPQLTASADKKETAEAQSRCRTGSRSGVNLSSIGDLELPAPGLWQLQLWLIDASGNQQPATAVELDGLGYDDSPPQAI